MEHLETIELTQNVTSVTFTNFNNGNTVMVLASALTTNEGRVWVQANTADSNFSVRGLNYGNFPRYAGSQFPVASNGGQNNLILYSSNHNTGRFSQAGYTTTFEPTTSRNRGMGSGGYYRGGSGGGSNLILSAQSSDILAGSTFTLYEMYYN